MFVDWYFANSFIRLVVIEGRTSRGGQLLLLVLRLTVLLYIITQVILAFWLVLSYDLLEDRRIDDDSARFKLFFEFWIWTNHNSLLSIATNQFASFCIDIRWRQCYFRVCQSGQIWNKKAAPRVPLFCSHRILTSSVIYYWTDARQHILFYSFLLFSVYLKKHNHLYQ